MLTRINFSTGTTTEERCATQANMFRHGQLVNMSITIRSIKRFPDLRFPTFNRSIAIGLKGLTVVSRDTEMVMTKRCNMSNQLTRLYIIGTDEATQ